LGCRTSPKVAESLDLPLNLILRRLHGLEAGTGMGRRISGGAVQSQEQMIYLYLVTGNGEYWDKVEMDSDGRQKTRQSRGRGWVTAPSARAVLSQVTLAQAGISGAVDRICVIFFSVSLL
jgi:hypothetical protein